MYMYRILAMKEFKSLLQMVSSLQNGVHVVQLMDSLYAHIILLWITVPTMFMYRILATAEFKSLLQMASSLQNGVHVVQQMDSLEEVMAPFLQAQLVLQYITKVMYMYRILAMTEFKSLLQMASSLQNGVQVVQLMDSFVFQRALQ